MPEDQIVLQGSERVAPAAAGMIGNMECLPPSLAGKRYYLPTGPRLEKRIRERIEEIGRAREKEPHA